MKRSLWFVLTFAVMALAVLWNHAPASAQATTIVVNSAADNINVACSVSVCTLRKAIEQSNSTVGVKETITFNINPSGNPKCNPVPGICVITLKNALPEITDPVTIDGYTQPGASPNTLVVGNDAQLRIEIKGKDKAFKGLVVKAHDTTIKGLVLNKFQYAIALFGNNGLVAGNFIGMNPNGTTASGNYGGVFVGKGAQDNHIGGDVDARNVISGNEREGIWLSESHSSVIQGNYIGTDKSGMNIPGNGTGILLRKSSGNKIGGESEISRNVISGNFSWGIRLWDKTRTSEIRGNYIGVGSDGKAPRPNSIGIGVMGDDIRDILISKNVIAHSNKWGIQFSGDNSVSVAILENSIFNNGMLGIDLKANGVTGNDDKDQDMGENNLQNYPVLKKVDTHALGTTINAKLNSLPFTTFRIEYFTSAKCDASGNGQGKTFLGSQNVTTGIPGNAAFSFQSNLILNPGAIVTATATELNSNSNPLSTSEFSKCKAAQ